MFYRQFQQWIKSVSTDIFDFPFNYPMVLMLCNPVSCDRTASWYTLLDNFSEILVFPFKASNKHIFECEKPKLIVQVQVKFAL